MNTLPIEISTGFSSHAQSWSQLTGRLPTRFESATADALWKAYMATRETPNRFKAVSAATGSGKTLGAVAMIAHLFPNTAAIVIREVKEARQVYQALCTLVGAENVGFYASRQSVAKFEDEQGEDFGPVHTKAELRALPVVVCTHRLWKNECLDDRDFGIRICRDHQRNLIVIDEEPELETVFAAQPEDVSKLASVLSDVMKADEARAYDFASHHIAVPVLNAIHDRMRLVKDNKNTAQLLPQGDLVGDSEADVLLRLDYGDISNRLCHLRPEERMRIADELWVVLQFLHAACEGRVFYSKGYRGQFLAYSYALPPQKNTIILDGTADLNGLYSIGESLITLDAPAANYEDVKLHYLPLPKRWAGQAAWKPEQVRKVAKMRPFMDWFHAQVIAHTSPGERVLVYAPLALLDADLHNEVDWEGRVMRFQHFGSGRGTNAFKDVDVYFQLRAFYLPKGQIVARTLSHTGELPNEKRFKNLSSGKTRDPSYIAVRDTLVAADTKQNAARICIRQLDDNGKAKAARLYFVSDNLPLLDDYAEAMFPGAGPVQLEADPAADVESMTGPERLVHLLATFEGDLIEWSQLPDLTGIAKQHIPRALKSAVGAAVARTRGWQQRTRKQAGLSGKGYVLTR